MPAQLSELVTRMRESETIAMAQLSRELRSNGHDVIDLSLGEPDFTTPKHICDAAVRALEDGHTHYPPVPGYPELRRAIADKFARDNNLTIDPAQVVVSTGAKQSLANLMMALVAPGDEVILPAPYWVSYSAQVDLVGGTLVTVESTIDTDFKIDPQELEAAITPRTKVFLFSSPCNPTGTSYTADELGAIAEVLLRHPQVTVISDEIYEYIVFNGKHESISQFEDLHDRLVVVNGFSKGFAMTGWRLGYIAAPMAIAKACTKIQGQFTSGANSIAQRAAIAALEEDLGPTLQMRDAFHRRRDLFLEGLSGIEGLRLNKPQGAFYLFPNIEDLLGKTHQGERLDTVDAFCLKLLHAKHVSIVTGNAFGNPRCVRLSYANSEANLSEAASRIKEFISELH